VEAFPWDTAPRYLLRDRDAIYGAVFSRQVQALGIHEVKIAPRAPWQNPYVERLIGTLRRECLDHVVVLNATHLRRLLRDYLIYYHSARTHLSLDKDAPEPRAVEASIKAGSSRHPWSAASITGTAAGQHKPRPTAAPATLTSAARGCPSQPRLPFPPAGPVFGFTNPWPRSGVSDRQPPVVPPGARDG
jgi:hypothetical protein